MRVTQTAMDKNHERVVESASRLMRKQGIEATSVKDVMNKARLTHGGFYRHFDSKESLVSAALEDAFHEVVSAVDASYRAFGVKKGSEKYSEHYLSKGHMKHPELGCPIAALSMDVARSTVSVKGAFADGFGRVVEKLAEAEEGTAEEKRVSAMRKISMLAGAVMIARATDPKTADAVLAACKGA